MTGKQALSRLLLMVGIVTGAVMAMHSPLVAAAGIDCELMIARVGVGGGLQVRVPLTRMVAEDQQTLQHLKSADAEQIAHLMTSLSRVIWPGHEQQSEQWRFADMHLDGSQQWLVLRIRPQGSLPDMPGGCLVASRH
ncbi:MULTISPECIES: hypothetical protein [unclassified Oceanobacter]|jgi:hypothetical protein|uniref:hypothetical protein n=1 Tax=unclassified Oceanobacter TaxID=2620260 RepID=UPI0026E295A2|nr:MULTISPECIES: hypothetical protein [unclassified Oceanobacter]MDO6682359.1 hypothetical protein [Oceanobacter sp. 5_MG-2023]MDP2506005.1 hypothetical protein [Oceanobacter sp. 3_MG-2023]MDP2547585.1 hypothetical protein [Oceanobacter sp. 4_MG-2023]